MLHLTLECVFICVASFSNKPGSHLTLVSLMRSPPCTTAASCQHLTTTTSQLQFSLSLLIIHPLLNLEPRRNLINKNEMNREIPGFYYGPSLFCLFSIVFLFPVLPPLPPTLET